MTAWSATGMPSCQRRLAVMCWAPSSAAASVSSRTTSTPAATAARAMEVPSSPVPMTTRLASGPAGGSPGWPESGRHRRPPLPLTGAAARTPRPRGRRLEDGLLHDLSGRSRCFLDNSGSSTRPGRRERWRARCRQRLLTTPGEPPPARPDAPPDQPGRRLAARPAGRCRRGTRAGGSGTGSQRCGDLLHPARGSGRRATAGLSPSAGRAGSPRSCQADQDMTEL